MKSFLADRPRTPGPAAPATPEPIPFQAPPAEAPRAFAALAAPRPAAAPAPAKPHASPAHASTVECVREGDRVTRLVVTCSCGERTEIDCLYTGA